MLKTHGIPIIKNAFYLVWDHLHNDVEVYGKNKRHLDSLDPETLLLYKPSLPERKPF